MCVCVCVSLRATSRYMHIEKCARKAHVKDGGAKIRGLRRECVCETGFSGAGCWQ